MYNPDEITNIALLSSYLRTSSDSLNRFIGGTRLILDLNSMNSQILNPNPQTQKSDILFERFYIPKRNAKLGYRIVYKIWNQFAVDILKVLKFNLNSLYIPENCVHGFVLNRNTRTNALNHLGKKYLLKLDIENFFESIKFSSVLHAFKALKFKEDIATNLSSICTLESKLVAGFPTSPIVANIFCSEMDKELSHLCKICKATYTRYADDISISSDYSYPDTNKIIDILKSHGFVLNPLKSQRFKYGQNQYVTGLSISDKKYPRIPKPIKRRLRQQLHYLSLYGYHSHICYTNGWDEKTHISITYPIASKLRNNIKGWIDYMNPIEPKLAKQFYEIFNQIEDRENEERKKRIKEIIQKTGGLITIGELDAAEEQPILKKE